MMTLGEMVRLPDYFWAFVFERAPIRMGHDRFYVSPEVYLALDATTRQEWPVYVDDYLEGLEMRHERTR